MNINSELAMASELEDLGNLFEFGDIDLNNIADAGDFGNHMQQQHGTHPNTPFQDIGEESALSGTLAQDFGGHEQFGVSQAHPQHFMQHQDKHAPTSNPYTIQSMYQSAIQQPSYYQRPHDYQLHGQQGYPLNQHVPPTPTSFEMHGESGHFMQQHAQMDAQQRAIMEQRYSLRKDDGIAFTPMVSPAGTPQYNILPEFTTPGAYFSPLTSPMLHGQIPQHVHLQHHQQQSHGYLTNPSTAPSSHTNSPIDPNLDVDMLGDSTALPNSTGPQPRKSRRRIATPKSFGAGAKASPSIGVKSQKRKSTTSSSNAQNYTTENMSSRALQSQPPSASLQTPATLDSSEAESISPEPLSESLMGPPPRPGSRMNQSPVFIGQQQSATTMGTAATPKSLLTMRPNQPSSNGHFSPNQHPDHISVEPGGLDDLSLPEAATRQAIRRPSLTQINTQIPLDVDENTPRLSARKTPKLGPLSTPASARPSSAIDSPLIGSPMTASTPSAILNKNDIKGGRNSKKRGSMSANGSKLVSPALVPKISPSIKPLLPEGTPLNSAQQAMLLASKSNYQNLVEGNRLPGVNYPDSLSTGLASKRTSHKVAEQGRRNRINEALKEMQALIPKSPASVGKSPAKEAETEGSGSPEVVDGETEGNTKESKEEAAARSNSSKAATVELANEYIKLMQKESEAQTADLLQVKRENEELKRRLAQQSGRQSCTDSPRQALGSASPSPASVKV